ncbi:uncharacterized protein LOC106178132 isoform X1 [Lingula anatina]|uniref:Uncharacterized protein LOC106178132 isoform X1 n=1 Tax=Lingula anatina TaxID=7574 RepID=A0A1S3K2M6_LINAN|nr:uncharacterized protein LOC106178132 isoform X1 [Lingula anatina]|eukprot:XP_013416649.1 uncharacterized protein LOC106178132 isoform X1 [Lingula anatina]
MLSLCVMWIFYTMLWSQVLDTASCERTWAARSISISVTRERSERKQTVVAVFQKSQNADQLYTISGPEKWIKNLERTISMDYRNIVLDIARKGTAKNRHQRSLTGSNYKETILTKNFSENLGSALQENIDFNATVLYEHKVDWSLPVFENSSENLNDSNSADRGRNDAMVYVLISTDVWCVFTNIMNTLIWTKLKKEPHSKHFISFFIVLAVSDGLTCAMRFPIYMAKGIAPLLPKYASKDLRMLHVYCSAISKLIFYFSHLLLTSISVGRFLVLRYPLLIYKRKSAVKKLTFVWISILLFVVIIIAITQFQTLASGKKIDRTHAEIVAIVIPLAIQLISGSCLLRLMTIRNSQAKGPTGPVSQSLSAQNNITAAITFNTLAAFMLILPYTVHTTLVNAGLVKRSGLITHILSTFRVMNCGVNFIIYLLTHVRFRKKIQEVLHIDVICRKNKIQANPETDNESIQQSGNGGNPFETFQFIRLGVVNNLNTVDTMPQSNVNGQE